jgi:tetratricopeptide (TPR) repeat protein
MLAASLVLLALLAGIAGTTWQAVRAERRAEGELLAKERAEANFAIANEAVEKYLGTVTNHRKLNQADFHQLRKELLESALPFLQKLTEQKSEAPEVEARRGWAYGRLANVRYAMGENEAAIQDSEAERAIFARLTADFPTRPAYRDDLASSLNDLGHTLTHVGKRREAEAAYRQAMGLRDKLAAEFPAEPKYRSGLAIICDNLAILLDDLGQREEAETLHRKSIAIREKLAAEFRSKPKYQEYLANTLTNLGGLLSDLGKEGDAETACRQALEIRESLAAKFPDEPEYRSGLARSQNNLGVLLKDLGKHEKAGALYRQAIAIQKKLADDFPTVPEHRQDLAVSHHNLGGVLEDLNKDDDADAAFRQAIDIHQKLADDFPTVPIYRRQLAASHNNLGILLEKLGKRPQAEAAYRRALAIQEKLAAVFPNVPQHAIDLAGGYCNLGNWLQIGGESAAALDWFQKAIATLEPVVAKEPRLVDGREFLRNSYEGRAEALVNLGRPAEATRAWERALELDDGGRKAIFRLQIARNKKDAAGCLAAAAEHEARKPTDAGGLYNAGCFRAVCAAVIREDPKTPTADAPRLAKEQADLAMAWLHKAVAAGYKNARHMKQDKELLALSDRADFKKLLADLEMKKK